MGFNRSAKETLHFSQFIESRIEVLQKYMWLSEHSKDVCGMHERYDLVWYGKKQSLRKGINF